MPRTIIYIETWRCTSCNYADNQGPDGAQCVACGQEMRKTTDEKLKTRLTIVGEEDIEDELDPLKEDIPMRYEMPVKNEAQKEAYRVKRREDIANAIASARLKEDK